MFMFPLKNLARKGLIFLHATEYHCSPDLKMNYIVQWVHYNEDHLVLQREMNHKLHDEDQRKLRQSNISESL